MICDRSNQVHAYHDGELPAGERDALEAHVRSCDECRELLAELRGLSRMIMAAPLAEMPGDVMQRLRDARYVLPDAGVLKIAGWLTAAAAAVLMTALLYFPRQQDAGNALAVSDSILDEAVTPPLETASAEGTRSDLVTLAQWMADDLSSNEVH